MDPELMYTVKSMKLSHLGVWFICVAVAHALKSAYQTFKRHLNLATFYSTNQENNCSVTFCELKIIVECCFRCAVKKKIFLIFL